MIQMTQEQLFEISKELAPAALSIIGTIIAALLAAIGWGLRRAWVIHTRRIKSMAMIIDSLTKAINDNKYSHEHEDRNLRDSLSGIRSEMAMSTHAMRNEAAMLSSRLDQSIKGIAGAEAVVRLQQDKLDKLSEALAHVNGKLVAVFRFIDAPRRGSGESGESGESGASDRTSR